ncbi:MAG: hypothetical protein AAGC44_04365 [Planctomycetota bacterium]
MHPDAVHLVRLMEDDGFEVTFKSTVDGAWVQAIENPTGERLEVRRDDGHTLAESAQKLSQ